jgi:peptidoglycan/LPS O-acetylase OafA/YrhL
MENKKLYFNSIDGLRLFAAVNVVLYHYERMGGFNNLGGNPSWFFSIIKGPAFHASLFFILAGFIFTIKYSQERSEFSTFTFIKSRLRQLYPLHIISTLSMVPFIFLSGEYIDMAKFSDSIILHLSMLYPFFPGDYNTLNMPSWALSAFFFCYLFFKKALVFVNSISSKKVVVATMLIPFAAVFLWGALFGILGTPDSLKNLFHMFPPYRFMEFLTGMLVARIFTLRQGNTEKKQFGFINDIAIIVTLIFMYQNLQFRTGRGDLFEWYSYHLIMPILHTVLLYRLARGTGLISKIMSFSWIRNVGKSSFYPYLLHIPAMAWLCYILENYFGYDTFLHSPINLGAFIVILYSLSTFYVMRLRKRPVSKFKNEIKK